MSITTPQNLDPMTSPTGSIPASSPSNPVTKTFQVGDTAIGVAKANNIPLDAFLKANPHLAAKGNSGDFGGLTGLVLPGQSYTIPTNNMVVTSGPARTENLQYSQKLSNALGSFGINNQQNNTNNTNTDGAPSGEIGKNYTDDYTSMLDAELQRSDASTKRLIGNIQATRQRNQQGIDNQYRNYKSGLQLLGIQHNAAQFTPDLLVGHIQQAENEHKSKLMDLDREETRALMEAEDAQKSNNFKLLKEKMDYVDKIRKDKKDELSNFYDNLIKQDKVSEVVSSQIYNAVQGLDEADKEVFLQKAAEKYKIPLGTLIQALADQKTARTKKAASGTGGGYSALELRKLRAKGIDPSDTATADDFLYNGVEPEDTSKGRTPTQQLSVNPRIGRKLADAGFDSEDVIKLQQALAAGYTLDEVNALEGFDDSVLSLLNKYIKDL